MQPRISSAQDIWVYSREGYEYYLTTENISVRDSQPPFTCNVKVVYNGKYDNFEILGFESQNDILVGYSFWRSHGTWEFVGTVSKKPYLNAVWQAMKPYLKQQGVIGVDGWH